MTELQLKEKLQETKTRNEQIQALTVLLKSWSVKKVQQKSLVSQSILFYFIYEISAG